MLTKRIIPCLDVKNGRVVKGTKFIGLKDAGDPVELAKKYDNEGADEIVFLDITASCENRHAIVEVVEKTAAGVFIPLTVGGGITTVDDIRILLKAGADKIALNTAAVKNPQLIAHAADLFGSQCIVLAVDAKKQNNHWEVVIHGGRTATGLDALEWIETGVKMGAGEILLTSMDQDGTKDGYDITLTALAAECAGVPIIASGGAGELSHFADVLKHGKADAVLAASVFHYGQFSVRQVKEYLKMQGVEIRL